MKRRIKFRDESEVKVSVEARLERLEFIYVAGKTDGGSVFHSLKIIEINEFENAFVWLVGI